MQSLHTTLVSDATQLVQLAHLGCWAILVIHLPNSHCH